MLVKVGYASSVYFFNSLIEYDSYNTSTKILYTIKIENTRYSKKFIESRGHNRSGANGTQGPIYARHRP